MAGCNTCANMSGKQLLNAFIEAPVQLADQMTVEILQYPSYWIGLAPVLPFPNFSGTELQRNKLSFRHSDPYYGLEGWQAVRGSFGSHDACALPPAHSIGWGIERKSFGLMERRLNTPEFCLRDIMTAYDGDETFGQIIKSLSVTSALERERLVRNLYFIRAQKYIALPGFPQNTANAYDFPLIPLATELSVLTYHQLLFFYNFIVKNNPEHMLGMADGQPLVGIACSDQTWHDMVAEDDQLYQAVIRSPLVGDFLSKYNFTQKVGPFVHMPDYEAERFDRDTTGKFIPVSPTINIPVERGYNPDGPDAFGSGSKTIPNPHYEFAKYEAVKLVVKNAVALRVRPEVTSLGGEGSFGPEPRMFEWNLVQVERCSDIYRRKLWYEAYAELGPDWGDAEPIVIMVRRDMNNRLFRSPAPAVCPTVDDCEVTIPAQGCPCPKVRCVVKTEFDNQLLFTFDGPTGAVVAEYPDPANTLKILKNDGTYDTVDIIAVNGNDVKVEFTTNVVPVEGLWLELVCGEAPTFACTTRVRYDCPCDSGVVNAVDVSVENEINCNSEDDEVTVTFGDGTTATMTLAADHVVGTKIYTLDFTPAVTSTEGDVCRLRGIKSLCCVPTEGNGCPECGPTFEDCDPEAAPPSPLE